jgi:hypothetical protein
MTSIRHWCIIAGIKLTLIPIGDKPPEPGSMLPQSLKFISRIPRKISSKVDGCLITLQPWLGEPLPLDGLSDSPSELAALTLLREAETPELALSEADNLLELIIDDLSFQIQEVIHIHALSVVDVTPPLELGMTREILMYPFPMGYTSPKFRQTFSLENFKTIATPKLRSVYGFENEKTRAALRWYVKGLAAPFDADKFAFYWVSLEISCSQSDVVVEKPYAPSCGHEIAICPVCQTPTSRVINGPTIKKFLTEKLGISLETAKQLWSMRQMFHGANQLSHRAVMELPKLVTALRHAALIALKDALAISKEEFPISVPESAGLSRQFAFGGTTEITNDVIQYLNS